MQSARNLLSFSKTYQLPLAREYVKHWGLPEAVREIIQNALDSDSPFEYQFGPDWLAVHSRNASLSPQTLLLGKTSKADADDKIGSFGEGYKIAMLVLARAGYPLVIRNRDRTWTPYFAHSNTFDAEVLCVKDAPAEQANEGLSFIVSGLTPDDIASIRASCLYMQDNIGAFNQTSRGRILRDQPGKLYVGSLYVCDTELGFGYDVLPKYLRLERDRQTVSSFDLAWLAKEMWFETERYEEIADLMAREIPDMQYADHGAPALVKEACYRLFREKFGDGKILANSPEHLQEMIKKNMTQYVGGYYSSSFGSALRGSSSYQSIAPPPAPAKKPQDVLTEFLAKNKHKMQAFAIVNFKQLIKDAADWKAK